MYPIFFINMNQHFNATVLFEHEHVILHYNMLLIAMQCAVVERCQHGNRRSLFPAYRRALDALFPFFFLQKTTISFYSKN